MTAPVIRNVTTYSRTQGFFLAQGRDIPSEVFKTYVQSQAFNTNGKYWIRKATAGVLQPVRIEEANPRELPEAIAGVALDLDIEGGLYREFRLLIGNTAGTAVEIAHDATVSRRWEVMFSL